MRFRLRLFVAEEYKPLRSVSPWLWLLTIGAFAGQIAFHYYLPPPASQAVALETPPSDAVFRLSALGEPTTLAKLLAMRIQAFDNQPGISIPFREMDYDIIGEWLDRIVALDERAEYPHFLMAKIYSAVNDNERRRIAAEWTRRQFLKMPAARWEWMAYVTNMAKHVIKDDALALTLARELRENISPDDDVPGWTRQMEIFFLENQDEFSAAAAMLEHQLESGEVREPQEFQFLSERLEKLIKKSYEAGDIGREQAFERIDKIQKLTEQYLQQFDEQ